MLTVEDSALMNNKDEEVHNDSSDDDDDDDDDDEEEEEEALIHASSVQFNAVIPAVILSWLKACNWQHRSTRRILHNPVLFNERLQWSQFIQRFDGRADFKRHIQMSLDSFTKVLSHIRPLLVVDAEMARRRGVEMNPLSPCLLAILCWWLLLLHTILYW
jgi:hypothetical protein